MIGKRIKEIRNEFDLSLENFARRVLFHPNEISKWENGEIEPPEIYIDKMCMEFHVNPEWLNEGTGEKYLNLIKFPLFKDEQELIQLYRQIDEDFKLAVFKALETFENFLPKITSIIKEKEPRDNKERRKTKKTIWLGPDRRGKEQD